MSRQTSITCDQCGLQKKESNHWWSIYCALDLQNFTICPQLTVPQEIPQTCLFEACSEECAHRLLGKWMRGELGK